MKKSVFIAAMLCLAGVLNAKEILPATFGDSTKQHVFTLSANLFTRGEYIQGALPDPKETYAAYVMERTRLTFHYKQPYLEVQITPQHAGVWGTTGGGSFSLQEAWAQADVKGLFLKLGRQTLSYDDERVIGLNDWSMTGSKHDCIKLGYEGYGHKVHLIGAYNQTDLNTSGGTYYAGGYQVYKNMQTLWYHYDFKRWFSASLLFINTGMQSVLTSRLDTTFYQQLVGTYAKFRYPQKADNWYIDVDASFYYQFGKTEDNLPISAWMAAAEIRSKVNDYLKLNTGYFHLSGDEDYTVPGQRQVGMKLHTHDHSFNLLYASHHQFYGAMDFFYLETFFGGYSPGLQDWHLGATFTLPRKIEAPEKTDVMFDFNAEYHALATSKLVHNAPGRLLGHELVLTANYYPLSWMTVTAGYTFMQGTKTMEIVKRATNRNQSHWVYLMLVIKPTFLKVRF